MIAALALALMLLLIPLTGGSFRRLSELRLRFEVPILGLFILQGVMRGRLPFTAEVGEFSVIAWAAICVALVVMLWFNRDITGVPIIIAGFLLNLFVVLLNSGMPYIVPVGVTSMGTSTGFYQPVDAMTQMAWLGDVLPLPFDRWLLSLGDLLLMVGVVTVGVAAANAQVNQVRVPIR